MNITVSHSNLFDAPRGFYLINCISRDLRFTRLPGEFDSRYNIADKMKNQQGRLGYLAQRTRVYAVADVLNLIVKESSFEPVILSDLIDALDELSLYCAEYHIDKIAMPKICTGRNGIDWEDAVSAIVAAFAQNNITIMICLGE